MPLLTVEELRKHVEYPTGADADDALQRLLDDAERLIVEHAGTPGVVTEVIDGGWSAIVLSRPIGSVTSITETVGSTVSTLTTDDYRWTTGGYVLRRLYPSTGLTSRWSGLVTVTYTPVEDTVGRELAQVDLVKLSIATEPGITQRTIGAWSESYSPDRDIVTQRLDILSRLRAGTTMVVL